MVEWDIWNEPDYEGLWKRDHDRMFATQKRAYQRIRAFDDRALIVGPSLANFNAQWLRAFLEYAKANDVLPEIVGWHEMSWTRLGYKSIPAQVAYARSFMAEQGAVNADAGEVRLLLGRHGGMGGDVEVRFVNLDGTLSSPPDGKMRIVARRIHDSAWEASAGPMEVGEVEHALKGNELTVRLPEFGPSDAYLLRLCGSAGDFRERRPAITEKESTDTSVHCRFGREVKGRNEPLALIEPGQTVQLNMLPRVELVVWHGLVRDSAVRGARHPVREERRPSRRRDADARTPPGTWRGGRRGWSCTTRRRR